jgi:hypothetical protein
MTTLSFMKLIISTLVSVTLIRKWFHAVSKYNESTPGSFFFFQITFKMQITDYLASANSHIHTLHFDPGGLQHVHLLCTNCEQTKHSVNTFSVFSWALD